MQINEWLTIKDIHKYKNKQLMIYWNNQLKIGSFKFQSKQHTLLFHGQN